MKQQNLRSSTLLLHVLGAKQKAEQLKKKQKA